MDRKEAQDFITALFDMALKRKPQKSEVTAHAEALTSGRKSPLDFIQWVAQSPEHAVKRGVKTFFPIGHFHSPVVNPEEVRSYFSREVSLRLEEIAGIPLDVAAMRTLWIDNLPFIQQTPFTDMPNGENRYSYTGGPFPRGDGIITRMMMGHFRPKRVIEIGSGYSSACMLDAADHANLDPFELTCIEPNTARLRSLLRESDVSRVKVIEKFVQQVPADIVDTLEAGDFLFIDSTHVMKTGSDVHYELFYLLPRLKPGVIVHVHDVPYPFEYPHQWVFEDNFSWNEAYVLRAFLMYNTKFQIIFWNSLVAKTYQNEITREFPTFLTNSGGSIWIEKTQC